MEVGKRQEGLISRSSKEARGRGLGSVNTAFVHISVSWSFWLPCKSQAGAMAACYLSTLKAEVGGAQDKLAS